jgi:hypothetical protein
MQKEGLRLQLESTRKKAINKNGKSGKLNMKK